MNVSTPHCKQGSNYVRLIYSAKLELKTGGRQPDLDGYIENGNGSCTKNEKEQLFNDRFSLMATIGS